MSNMGFVVVQRDESASWGYLVGAAFGISYRMCRQTRKHLSSPLIADGRHEGCIFGLIATFVRRNAAPVR
jgi:hypothetical protein